jgi:hypothetical protein
MPATTWQLNIPFSWFGKHNEGMHLNSKWLHMQKGTAPHTDGVYIRDEVQQQSCTTSDAAAAAEQPLPQRLSRCGTVAPRHPYVGTYSVLKLLATPADSSTFIPTGLLQTCI